MISQEKATGFGNFHFTTSDDFQGCRFLNPFTPLKKGETVGSRLVDFVGGQNGTARHNQLFTSSSFKKKQPQRRNFRPGWGCSYFLSL